MPAMRDKMPIAFKQMNNINKININTNASGLSGVKRNQNNTTKSTEEQGKDISISNKIVKRFIQNSVNQKLLYA